MISQPNLTPQEQWAQAARCPCRGSDDYCICQNVPDRLTRQQRAAVKIAAVLTEAVYERITEPLEHGADHSGGYHGRRP
jgi:hypothetical protein